MMLPNKRHLRQYAGGSWVRLICLGGPLHPQPRMYKHYWRVFTLDSQWEGREFLDKATPLSTAAYIELIRQLQSENKPCMVYGYKMPRHGSIFDPASPKWKDTVFAPAWDEDTDPVFEGHK
jgi:hypothetical protein